MPYPGLLHPEPLPLWQSTADPYLHRRHPNTVLWGLWVLVHTILSPLSVSGGHGFDSKCDFAPPTILLGLLLYPWTWGIFFWWDPTLSKPGFSNMWTVNFQMLKLVLEKAEEPEIKLLTSSRSSKKQESSRKTSISALLTMPKPLTVWITINYGKFWKKWEYETTWPASWETYMRVRKQQLELDMEQQTGSK